ncbi:GxGYxYP family putative glycoside hydrolase [Akkermansiaceae bacterium]|nr:GxGYxYP family putative glycoside hydrolase [Akkermansiaceae bacterium]
MKTIFAALTLVLTAPVFSEGLTWPLGQALPWFSTPAPELDAISLRDLNADGRLTFSALQGQINRTQPRIFLENHRAEEGPDTWPDSATIRLGPRTPLSKEALLKKYAQEISGVVLYDPGKSSHYRNLAGTVAGIHKALPMTKESFDHFKSAGIDLKIIEDLTGATFTAPLEIYQHLYDNYWPKCTKRVILSARPSTRGGDHHHTRDIASAVGAAVIWLDGKKREERALMERFFSDMEAGNAIALGWYTSERSGITAASTYGIGTVPADHFTNGSVYSGSDHHIRIPEVPKLPTLENKSYVALFISDGDNIQYTQHAMRRIWDQSKDHRGKTALNWTIAPGLVDIAPGILNHYYTTATPKDCFVTGPSGMGYAMPYNTLTEPGAPIGPFLTDPDRMKGYAAMTERYLQRSGLRVITIWDSATPMQRAAYETHCRSLYGATVQNFKDVPSVKSSIENQRLRFEKLVIPYTTTAEHLHGSLTRELKNKSPDSPQFLAYQINIWKELKPERLNQLAARISQQFPGQVEFIRADHYFNLFNEAHDLPYNLSLRATTQQEGASSLIDLTQEATITRLRILSQQQLTPGFSLQSSIDRQEWRPIEINSDQLKSSLDFEIPPTKTRYLKVASPDRPLTEIEIYGQ